jgi:hypothetical protein
VSACNTHNTLRLHGVNGHRNHLLTTLLPDRPLRTPLLMTGRSSLCSAPASHSLDACPRLKQPCSTTQAAAVFQVRPGV